LANGIIYSFPLLENRLMLLYNIRLGRYAKGRASCDAELMIRMGLPEWFPEYASSILYLFPKSHCVDFAYRNIVEAWNELEGED